VAAHPFGTTAWRLSMGRRQVVESVNAALKGTFADLSRGFFRVFGQTKMTILLGFTVAGYNLDRIRSYRAKKRAQQEAKPKPSPSGGGHLAGHRRADRRGGNRGGREPTHLANRSQVETGCRRRPASTRPYNRSGRARRPKIGPRWRAMRPRERP
jgi:hypothetical protein